MMMCALHAILKYVIISGQHLINMDLVTIVLYLICIIFIALCLGLIIYYNVKKWRESIGIFFMSIFEFKNTKLNRESARNEALYFKNFTENILSLENAENVMENLQDYLESDACKKAEILFFIFSSFGSDEGIINYNGKKIEVQKMVNIICDNCKDKKIFIFIQACRTTTNPTAPKEPTMLKKKIKNVVLFFATEYGAKAYRSNDGGSYFLKYVSETILAECTRTDLITMFEMIKEKTINARAEKQKLKPQRPEYKHTLPEAKQYLLPYKFLKELENDFDVIKENYLQSLEEITVHDEKFACFIKSIFTGLSHIFCRYLIES